MLTYAPAANRFRGSASDGEPRNVDGPNLRVQPGLRLERESGAGDVDWSHADAEVVFLTHVEADDTDLNDRRRRERPAERDMVAKDPVPFGRWLEQGPAFQRSVHDDGGGKQTEGGYVGH